MATNYDDFTKRRNQTALERYYQLKNGGNTQGVTPHQSTALTASPQEEALTKEEKKNKGGFLGGLGYLGHELGLGILRGIEGVVDYTVGGIADLFGADEFADDMMKTDWVNYNAADEWYNPGKGWEFAGDVTSGVGGMLPAVALTWATGGTAGAVLGSTMFGLGAAGQAVSEQTKKNGSAGGREWLYGTGAGLLETGIELASGGIGGSAAGKVLGKQLAKTTGGKLATSFIGEGLEEVASDILDPALQRVTGVDKEAKVDWGNLPRTFLVGGTTGAVMGGGQRALRAAQAGGFNNLNAMETAQEINERMSDNNVRQALGKKEIYTQKDIAEARDRLSANLQRMDENARATFLKQAGPRVSSFFNADGTVKQEIWENARPAETSRFSVDAESKSNSQSIGNLGGETYSASLKGRETTLKYQPAASTQGAENARAALRNIELLSGGRVDVVLTDELMTTADGQTANGEYADGVLYVNANADSYERAMFIASHELTHALEGTEAYGKLGAFIREQINGNSDFAEQYNLDKYRSAYANAQAGDFSAETLDYQAETEMYADFVAREILGKEDVVRRLVAKERNIVVRFLEWVRSALRRLGASREERAEYTTLKKAEKLLSVALENAKGGVSLEEVEENEQRKKALREMFAQEEVKSEMKSAESETQEVKKETTEENSVDVDAHSSARYLIKQFNADEYDYNKSIKTVANMKSVADLKGDEFVIGKTGLYTEISSYFDSINNNSYNEELGDVELKRRGIKDSVAHGLGELKTVAFRAVPAIIEKGKVVDYQKKWKGHEYDTAVIAAPITVAGEEYYAAVIVRRTQANQRFYLHEIDIKKRQTVQTEATTTDSSTQELGGLPINSIFEKLRNVNTSDEKTLKKSSRKSLDVDSEGRELTKEQAEYFKDSKVRDKNGNLLVVYHQTAGEFTQFDTKREGAGQSDHETPSGIFLKPTSEDIGLKGKRQMSLYVNITNPKQFYDREMARRHWKNNIEGYSDILKKIEENDRVYGEEFENAFNSDMPRAEYLRLSEEERERIAEEAEEREDAILAEWREANSVLERKAKELIDKYLRKSGFDGVFLARDVGSFGRVVQTFIALNPEQVKNIDNKNPTKNPDIRYSIDVEQSEKAKRDSGYVASLRQYVHRLNLTEEIKADIIEKYGEKTAKRLFNVWENTTNRADGVDIATAHDRLWREGFRTYSEYEEDFLMDMDTTLRGRATKLYEKAEKGKEIAVEDEKHVLPTAKREHKAESAERVELTDRQTEYLAKYTKKKVFTKQEAEIIINDILDGYMNYEDEVGSMRGKTREEVVKMLWRGMNSHDAGNRTSMARKIADYIMQHTVMENVYSDAIVQMHTDTIEALKPYLHKLDLDGIKGDIKYHYGDNSPYALWGKRKGESGIGVDVAAMELNERGFYIEEINPVDIFLRIDDAYRKAVDGLKTKTKKFATEIIGEKEQKALRDDMVKAILRAFDSHGSPSALTEMIREYDKKVQSWKDKYYEERDRNNLTARVLYKVQKLKDFEKGTFANATEFKRDIFKNTIGRLGRIKYRGNLNKSGTRKILAGLLEWYDKNNPMLEGEAYNEDIAQMLMQLADNAKPMTTAQYELIAKLEEKSKAYDFKSLAEWYTRENVGMEYSRDTKEWLEDLANPKEFSSEELKNLEHVIDYFRNFMEKYNKVYRNGKLVEAAPIAEGYIASMQKLKRTKVGWLTKWFEKYLKSFADPMTVARYFDKYDNGFFTEALEDLRKGAIAAQVMEQRLRAPLEDFYKEHKKFLEESEKRMIEYQGEQMNVQTAMLLYMTLKREQALRGLAYSGFKFKRGDYTVTVRGFATAENLDIDELTMQAAEQQNELARQFTESEREYISIVETIFNEDCKNAKSETDMARMGYTNISEGYYVPIRRASIAYNVEKQSYRDEVASVSDQSFNKDTVAGARNQLFIDGLTQVMEKHVGGISQYASLARALDNYNVLFNMNVSGNPNMAISVKSEAENVWADGGKFFSELIEDIKGVRKSTGVGHEWVSRVRSSYAKYQLGANPKVWVTQLSSFAAAVNILDPDCIIGGMGVKVDGGELDEYCGLAMVRNNENTAAIAQGVLEKTTNKIGDVLMMPIGKVDRYVVKRLFGACQLQVKKQGGGDVGTVENKRAAGELLERVILETQQNAMATEKSAAMRSGSEFSKAITMFSADSMKLTGRVVDAIGEVAVLKARLRTTTDATVAAVLKDKLSAANKQACRAIASVVLQAAIMTGIAELFKALYNKDEEDENKVKSLVTDTFGNMLGGLPMIRDVYSFFDDGYEVESFAYASINDLLAALGDARDVAAAVVSGKKLDDRELALTLRKAVYAAGQLTGIPTRNIYNMLYGLTKRVSPSTAYVWNDTFYKSSYRSDLAKAIEKGDEDMIATIVGLMLNENVGGVTDSAAREAIDALVVAGFDVIPRSVPDKVTYKDADGESVEVELTAKQATAFEKVYTVANAKVAGLVKSSQYKTASAEAQAKAIDFIYDTYYASAKNRLTGEGLTKNELFAAAIDIDKLSIIIAEAKLMAADTKNGVTVSGSKKAKIQKYVNSLRLTAVQKYMIMGYLGYKNANGAAQVKAYINRLNLSNEAKAALYQYSGYGE